MNNNNLNIFCVLVGVAGFGYALYTSRKLNKVCGKIDKTVDEISNDIAVDIPDVVINRAVERAVERETYIAVDRSINDSVRAIKADIHKQIKDAVDAEYSNIENTVSEKVAKEVANIDMKKLSESVREKAEQKIIDKFDDNLDGLLEKFNGKLDDVAKIYRSIANTFSANKEKETVLRIG